MHACLDKIRSIRYPGSPQPISLRDLVERNHAADLLSDNYPRLKHVHSSGGVQFIPELDKTAKGYLFLKPEQLDENIKPQHEMVSL